MEQPQITHPHVPATIPGKQNRNGTKGNFTRYLHTSKRVYRWGQPLEHLDAYPPPPSHPPPLRLFPWSPPVQTPSTTGCPARGWPSCSSSPSSSTGAPGQGFGPGFSSPFSPSPERTHPQKVSRPKCPTGVCGDETTESSILAACFTTRE